MAWPPESLTTIQTEDLINQCELLEVLPASAEGKQFVPVVELAALLYTGECVHARHLWRRWKDSNPPSYLVDWWTIGAAMMALSNGRSNSTSATLSIAELTGTIWNGLAHIQVTHPAPLCNYANEVGFAYRRRIVQRYCPNRKQQLPPPPPPQPYWTLLNFSSATEWEQFWNLTTSIMEQQQQQQHRNGGRADNNSSSSLQLRMDAKTSLTQVVAFMESKKPPSSSIENSTNNMVSGAAVARASKE